MIYYIDQVNVSKPFGSGGAPFFRNLAQYKNAHFKFILEGDPKLPLGNWFKFNFENNNINLFILRRSSNKFRWFHLPESVKFLLQLFIYQKRFKIKKGDYIFTRLYTVLWFFVFFKKNKKVIYYAPGLGNPILVGRRNKLFNVIVPLFDFIHFKALSRANLLLAAASKEEVNTINSRLIRSGIKKQFQMLPEGVDSDFFSPIPKQISRDKLKITDTYVFSYIGRLAEVKGIPLIIDSFCHFNRKYSDSKLFLIGDGEEKGKLSDHVNQTGIAEKIVFVGNVDPQRVKEYISASDACLFASFKEGFSFAMMEILACGRPIVTTKVSGTDELIIESETGFVVPVRNSTDFAEQMIRVIKINNVELKCRNHLINNYTFSKQWENLKKELPEIISHDFI